MALKRKRKAKSSALMTGAPTTTAQASGSLQVGPSSYSHPAHGHTSSLGQAGVSLQSIVGYGRSIFASCRRPHHLLHG